jgi:GT2 family glycosyltransferase
LGILYNFVFQCVKVKPSNSIQHEGANIYWHAEESNAFLNLDKRYLYGWYMMEFTVGDISSPQHCRFYVDDGRGLKEDQHFNLAIKSSGTVKRLVHFENPVKRIRFNLGASSGSILNYDIRFKSLTKKYALKFIRKKLSSRMLVLPKELNIKSLYEKYNALFVPAHVIQYQDWIIGTEPKLWHASVFNSGPLFSIIVPVFNSKRGWLEACIDSVVGQSYCNWELILVDDKSTYSETVDTLKSFELKNNKNIKVIWKESNGHICSATNVGLEAANGDYICFLDHDDMLASQALNELVLAITSTQAKILYSDEDLVSESGQRIVPHFKSDWNPELLRAHNYITHLCCYERKLLRGLGGMRLGCEGAQDYDLILRASAVVDSSEIFHIPKILYHWRMVEGSTALSSGAKSYTTKAGLKALRDYLTNNHIFADARLSGRDNFYTVKYSLPDKPLKVSIIIPTRDGMEVLRPCIETLVEKTTYDNYEIVILDNGSEKKETINFLSDLSKKSNVKIVRDDGEFNYSRINNIAVSYSDGELICLLNNDIEITDGNWLTEMVSIAIRKEVGCVGAMLLYPDGTIQHAGVILGLGGYAAHSHRNLDGSSPGYFCRVQIRQQLSAVTGACLVVRRSIYEKLGGLDEAFQVAYNDVDFCLRAQALGYQNIYTPFASLIHHESKTRGEDTSIEKTKRFDKEKALLLKRWSSVINNDPFYNLNLTRSREDFSIGQ